MIETKKKILRFVLLSWLFVSLVGGLVFLLPRAAGAAELLVLGQGGMVNIRQGPGLNYAVIGKVPRGTKLSYVAVQGGWYKVKLASGKTGWISGSLVKLVGLSAGNAPQASPSTVVVKGKAVNLRSGPGTNYAKVGVVFQGTRLTVLGRSGSWYRVKLANGKAAWIAAWLVSPLSQAQGEQDRLPQTGSLGKAFVKGDVVNLRSGPGTNYPVLRRLFRGEQLDLLETRGDWYRVRLASGQTGWVAGWLVQRVQESPAPVGSREGSVSRGPVPELPADTQVGSFTARVFTLPIRVLLATATTATVGVYGNYALVDGLTGKLIVRVSPEDFYGISLGVIPGGGVDQAVYGLNLERNRQYLGSFGGSLILQEGVSPYTGYFTLNVGGSSCRYRGNLVIRVQNEKIWFINELPLEEYLYGVVPREIPYHWPAEALKAQAVAARSYALRKIHDNAQLPYHVVATQTDQVYGGLNAERPETTAAVNATQGLVLKYGGEVIPAYYHSSSGGFTENSEDVWKNYCGYIRGKLDPYDRHPENPHYSWSVTLSVYDLVYRLHERGYDFSVVSEVYVTERTAVGGRLRALLVQGFDSSGQPRTEVLRNADWIRCLFRLKAPASDIIKTYDPVTGALVQVTFIGSGWGHALGMSQWGARTMAEQGLGFREILNFYYTNVNLEPA